MNSALPGQGSARADARVEVDSGDATGVPNPATPATTGQGRRGQCGQDRAADPGRHPGRARRRWGFGWACGRARPCPDLHRERPVPGRHRHVRHLAGERAPYEPRVLPADHPVRPRTRGRTPFGPVVRRGERRQVRAPGRPVPDHDRVPEGEHDAEHHAQHGDRTDAPDRRGSPVGEGHTSPAGAGHTSPTGAGHTSPVGPLPVSGRPAARTRRTAGRRAGRDARSARPTRASRPPPGAAHGARDRREPPFA
ncbi:hypothetical protein SPILM97S_03744 [Streptomyces pilosus]